MGSILIGLNGANVIKTVDLETRPDLETAPTLNQPMAVNLASGKQWII